MVAMEVEDGGGAAENIERWRRRNVFLLQNLSDNWHVKDVKELWYNLYVATENFDKNHASVH